MHLGIFAKTFPRPTFEESLDAIAARGITHVQFNLSCAGLPTLPERAAEDLCVWISRSFRERGLTMAAISGTFNLCDPDEVRLADNLRRLGVLASACRWLDTRIITLCTGTRDPVDMWKWHPENVRRPAWETMVHSMREAVKLADRHEVTLAFEPERNNVVNSVARARMLLDEIASPWLKVVIDPANLMGAEDRPRLAEVLDEAFDWLGADIVLAHAKNPPYLRAADRMNAIREYWAQGTDPEGIEALRQLIEVAVSGPDERLQRIAQIKALIRRGQPEPLIALDEFYLAYINKLAKRGYEGPLVMHGLAEEDVSSMELYLTAVIDHIGSGR